MAEPLKKDELRKIVPEPFPNQELRKEQGSLDTVDSTKAIPTIEASTTKVVSLRPAPVAVVEVAESETAQSYAQEQLDRLKGTVEEVGEKIADGFNQAREASSDLWRQGRRGFKYWSDQYPLQVIGVAAGLGILAGVLLRIRRSQRYEQ